jgi:hypothetical protein
MLNMLAAISREASVTGRSSSYSGPKSVLSGLFGNPPISFSYSGNMLNPPNVMILGPSTMSPGKSGSVSDMLVNSTSDVEPPNASITLANTTCPALYG